MAYFQAPLQRALARVAQPSLLGRSCLRLDRPALLSLLADVSRCGRPAAAYSTRARSGVQTRVPAAAWPRTACSGPALRSLSMSARRSAPPPVTSIPAEASTSAAAAAASASASAKTSSFPDTSSNAVAYWLIGSAVSVFGIVVWGGLTRLTESGLSITEWRPVTGAWPPRSEADWEAEFAKYRASPEYARLNPHMDLAEFKKIYFMEWTHRLWGRLIGLTFVVPAVYFVARRRVAKHLVGHLAGVAVLIGVQGAIGWWMVASGLREELFEPGAQPPRVSQYRLAAHLATAFVCYSWMLLAGLGVLRDRRLAADPAAAARAAQQLASPALRPLRLAVTLLTALVFTTAMSGALVAGLDAGLIYNEFPRMGEGLTPPRAELWDARYSRAPDQRDLWWRNMLENPSLVQLDHRILATTTFCAVLALFFYARRGRVAAVLPANVRRGTTGAVHLVLLQAALGISTLIYMVPTHLAATHQAGSLALLTGVLVLGHRLRMPPASLRLIQKRLAEAASAAKR